MAYSGYPWKIETLWSDRRELAGTQTMTHAALLIHASAPETQDMPGRHFPPASYTGSERNTRTTVSQVLGHKPYIHRLTQSSQQVCHFTDEKTEAWRSQRIFLLSLS